MPGEVKALGSPQRLCVFKAGVCSRGVCSRQHLALKAF